MFFCNGNPPSPRIPHRIIRPPVFCHCSFLQRKPRNLVLKKRKKSNPVDIFDCFIHILDAFRIIHFTPCMIHSPASFPMALSLLCFAALSIPHIDRVRQRYVYFCKKNDDISNLNLFVYPRPHPSDNISCSLRYLYASSVQRLLLFL